MSLISSLIVHNFSDNKHKKLYPYWKFISHFIRNTSDLKLKILCLICGTLLFREDFSGVHRKNGLVVKSVLFPENRRLRVSKVVSEFVQIQRSETYLRTTMRALQDLWVLNCVDWLIGRMIEKQQLVLENADYR